MDIDQLLSHINQDGYEKLNYVIETGRWPNGQRLSQTQRDHAMQAVMLYQSRHNTAAQHMSVEVGGAMKINSKDEMKRSFLPSQERIIVQDISDK